MRPRRATQLAIWSSAIGCFFGQSSSSRAKRMEERCLLRVSLFACRRACWLLVVVACLPGSVQYCFPRYAAAVPTYHAVPMPMPMPMPFFVVWCGLLYFSPSFPRLPTTTRASPTHAAWWTSKNRTAAQSWSGRLAGRIRTIRTIGRGGPKRAHTNLRL